MKTLTFKKTKAQIERNKRLKKNIARLKEIAAEISRTVKLMKDEERQSTF